MNVWDRLGLSIWLLCITALLLGVHHKVNRFESIALQIWEEVGSAE